LAVGKVLDPHSFRRGRPAIVSRGEQILRQAAGVYVGVERRGVGLLGETWLADEQTAGQDSEDGQDKTGKI
ncbi:MAG: hypothetical protein ABJJ72_07455, partial [Anderseniella sp.]